MHELIQKALTVSGTDYLEIRIEETTSTQVLYSGKELERIGVTTSRGGCVRAAVRGGWGFVSFNDIDQLPHHAHRAASIAQLVANQSTHLAPHTPGLLHESATPTTDPRTIPLEAKHDLADRYNRLLRTHPKIQTTSVQYLDRTKKKTLFTSDGLSAELEEVFCGISLAALAREGSTIQQHFHSYADLTGYDTVLGLEEDAETIARTAVDSLSADSVPAGSYKVITDPTLSGIFAHEAFGHLSESDFLDENPRLREAMALGRRFGPDQLTIADQGNLDQPGYLPFDDEGTPTARTDLLLHGVLKGRLHSRETAAKLDEAPTGNARSLSHHHPPIVRMTNTFIDNGDSNLDSMLQTVDDGIYCKGALAGQTNCEMFTFTALEAFTLKNGEIGRRLRDVVLSGNVFHTLGNIQLVGDDLAFHSGLGGCGKGGQSPLRVSTGGPHLLIDNVVVGGV